jgi:acetyltransferase-like isoleucine patch superfamily enzyme
MEIRIGENVFLDSDVTFKVPDQTFIGSNIAIDKGFYCTTKIKLGNYIHVGPYVTCIGGKNSSFEALGFNNIMAGARIICSSDRFDNSGLFGSMIPEHLRGNKINEPVIMEEFSNIGTNSIILPGSKLRKGVLVSAGSLLMGDTEEWGVYKGNPAVLVKKINPDKILSFAEELGYK